MKYAGTKNAWLLTYSMLPLPLTLKVICYIYILINLSTYDRCKIDMMNLNIGWDKSIEWS